MKMLHALFFIAVAAASSTALAENARREMKEGTRLFENGEHEKALSSFERAGELAKQNERLDPAVAAYNQGNALLKLGRLADAERKFADAVRSTDLSLQSRAYYNRGNALFGLAEEHEAQSRLDEAIKTLDEAGLMYERSMALSPEDEDPKVNFELALKKKEMLEELRQQQQQQQQQQDKQENEDEQKDQQEQQQKQDGDQQQDEEQEQQQEQSGSEGEDEQKEQQPEPEESSEDMTPEEAGMVLDAMKQEEQAQRDRLRVIHGRPVPVEKDW